MESWSAMARELSQRHQLSVLVFDYRGYGKSDGVPQNQESCLTAKPLMIG